MSDLMPTERQREAAMKVLVSLYCFDLDMDKARYERNAQDIGSFQEMDLRTIATALSEAEKRGMLRAAEIARVTKFVRICEPHEPAEVEVKITHHGCEEIAQAILKESEKETT